MPFYSQATRGVLHCRLDPTKKDSPTLCGGKGPTTRTLLDITCSKCLRKLAR